MAAEIYSRQYEILWADLDPNFHLRHTAYNDYAAQLRFSCLSENGYDFKKLQQLRLGPVLFKETTQYLKEVRAGDRITINFLIGGLSASGHKWKIQHEIRRGDGELAALVAVEGAWFDLVKRSVVAPPTELSNFMAQQPRTENFTEL